MLLFCLYKNVVSFHLFIYFLLSFCVLLCCLFRHLSHFVNYFMSLHVFVLAFIHFVIAWFCHYFICIIFMSLHAVAHPVNVFYSFFTAWCLFYVDFMVFHVIACFCISFTFFTFFIQLYYFYAFVHFLFPVAVWKSLKRKVATINKSSYYYYYYYIFTSFINSEMFEF